MADETTFKMVRITITFKNAFLYLISQANEQFGRILLVIINLILFTNYLIGNHYTQNEDDCVYNLALPRDNI